MTLINGDAERAALILIKKLGQDALIYTSLRVDEMREAKDDEGLAIWTRVHEAAQRRLKNDGGDDPAEAS